MRNTILYVTCASDIIKYNTENIRVYECDNSDNKALYINGDICDICIACNYDGSQSVKFTSATSRVYVFMDKHNITSCIIKEHNGCNTFVEYVRNGQNIASIKYKTRNGYSITIKFEDGIPMGYMTEVSTTHTTDTHTN